MLVEPGIHPRPGDIVEVVRKLRHRRALHVVRRAEHAVEPLQLGKPVRHHVFRPVVGRGHRLRPRCEQPRELHVARADPEQAGVLAGAAALHRGGHHALGKRDHRARVDRPKQDRLRAAAAAARDAQPARIDVGQAGEKIQGPDRHPRLQPHDRLQAHLRLGAKKAPSLRTRHVRPRLGEPVCQFVRDLAAVRVADHVVDERHTSHAGELRTKRQFRKPARGLEAFFAKHDLFSDALDAHVLQAAAMSMRAQHARERARSAGRTKQHTRDVEPRHRLEVDFLDREALALDLAVDHRIERRLHWHRPKTRRHEDSASQFLRAALPSLARVGYVERKEAVEILRRLEPDVGQWRGGSDRCRCDRQVGRRQRCRSEERGQSRKPRADRNGETSTGHGSGFGPHEVSPLVMNSRIGNERTHPTSNSLPCSALASDEHLRT